MDRWGLSWWIACIGLAAVRTQVIPAFFIDRDARFTLLFSHGNAEDLGMIIQYFRHLPPKCEACGESVGQLSNSWNNFGLFLWKRSWIVGDCFSCICFLGLEWKVRKWRSRGLKITLVVAVCFLIKMIWGDKTVEKVLRFPLKPGC